MWTLPCLQKILKISYGCQPNVGMRWTSNEKLKVIHSTNIVTMRIDVNATCNIYSVII